VGAETKRKLSKLKKTHRMTRMKAKRRRKLIEAKKIQSVA
jgi:hypothetical protein